VERWQSGRMRRTRNPVYGYTVSRVRIPPSPPDRISYAIDFIELNTINFIGKNSGTRSSTHNLARCDWI
jgi:hypothetical protein